MIGQFEFLKVIKSQIDLDAFPRFSIIVGNRGSQFYSIASEIANMLDANFASVSDVKVDTIRDVILESYKVVSKTLYFIENAEMMSAQAENALLKVTEEPPNNAYFILAVENFSILLPTIRSRGSGYVLDNYSMSDIMQYYQMIASEDKNDERVIKLLANTPGDVDMLCAMHPVEFYDFVEKVVHHIATASGSNAFKIAQKIKLKDTDEGYDLILFWKAVQQICFDENQFEACRVTGQYLWNAQMKSINKQMLFDSWILKMRKVIDCGS